MIIPQRKYSHGIDCLIYWFTHTGDVIIPTKEIYILTAFSCFSYWFTHMGDVIIPTTEIFSRHLAVCFTGLLTRVM